MQKFILLVTLLFLFFGCKLTERPEFVRVDKVDVVSADFKTVELKAEAVFMNHNHLGGSLRTNDINVFIDDHPIAKVSYEEFKVPARDEFVVPLTVNFDTSKIIEGKSNDLLGALLQQFLNKKVKVRFEGELVYKVAGYSSTYPINHIEEIVIK